MTEEDDRKNRRNLIFWVIFIVGTDSLAIMIWPH